MSFILDALKKSDAKRRAGDRPTLAAPPPPTPYARPSRTLTLSRAVGVTSLIVLSVAAAAVVWWGLRPDAAEDARPPVAERSDDVAPAEPTELTSEAMMASSSPKPTAPVSPPPAAATTLASAAQDPAPDRSTNPPQTEDPSASSDQTVRPPTDTASQEVDNARVAEALAEIPLPEAFEDGGESAAPEEPRTNGAPAAEGASVEESSGAWAPEEPDYLQYWELPVSVRQSLPSLRLNVHVYADLPENRFVLINGRRLQQGDVFHTSGLRLAEIRPEGALIDFNDYRFLLSQ